VVVGVIVEPLVSWIWIGGGVMLAGCALSLWPGRRKTRARRVDQEATPEPLGRVPLDEEAAMAAGSAV
jgi:cytochrome c biogenesis factor